MLSTSKLSLFINSLKDRFYQETSCSIVEASSLPSLSSKVVGSTQKVCDIQTILSLDTEICRNFVGSAELILTIEQLRSAHLSSLLCSILGLGNAKFIIFGTETMISGVGFRDSSIQLHTNCNKSMGLSVTDLIVVASFGQYKDNSALKVEVKEGKLVFKSVDLTFARKIKVKL